MADAANVTSTFDGVTSNEVLVAVRRRAGVTPGAVKARSTTSVLSLAGAPTWRVLEAARPLALVCRLVRFNGPGSPAPSARGIVTPLMRNGLPLSFNWRDEAKFAPAGTLAGGWALKLRE